MSSRKLLFCLGVIWTFPITLLAFLLYVCPFWIIGWYRYVGFHEMAFVWKLDEESPEWLHRMWDGWAAHTFGNIIVTVESPHISRFTELILTHELQHVRQYMKLGVFMLPLYGMFWLVIKVACANSHPYWDNPFELDACHGAGQITAFKGRHRR